MSKKELYRVPAIAALVVILAACGPRYGSGVGDADPYNGYIDNTLGSPLAAGVQTVQQGALATAIQPVVFTSTSATVRAPCNGAASCYYATQGYANGQVVSYFIAGNVASNTPEPPFIPTCAPDGFNCVYSPQIAVHQGDGGGGFTGYVFPNQCRPAAYNPVTDAFTRTAQYPIASALPLNNSSLSGARPPVGLVSIAGVDGVSGETCNDLKDDASIGDDKDNPGRFGSYAVPTGNFQVWMIFDPTLTVLSQSAGVALTTQHFWFRGLQGNYLASGPVPVDAKGNLIAMDGIILDPPGSAFEVPTTSHAVLLPAGPGDPGYSPIVRLHDFHLSTGQTVATSPYKGVCLLGQTNCPTGYLNLNTATGVGTTAFNTVFLVASAQ
jgi:hypothetical protein